MPENRKDGSACETLATRHRSKKRGTSGDDKGSKPRCCAQREVNQWPRSNISFVRVWIVAAIAMIGSTEAANAEHYANKVETQATRAETGEGMVTINVNGTNWGAGRPEVIKKLLENVAWHMTRHFRDRVPAAIEVVNHPLGPQILLRIPRQTTYTILLDTIDMYWAQYSYQFAHEFCHLVSNYEQGFGKPNQWIDETICETASLFTLRSMEVTWKEKPPYPPWRSFAKHLTAYADTQAGKLELQVPDDETWEGWFREHEAKAREDPYNREGNRIVALRLLPLFEQYPEGWNAIRSLPASQGTIGQYLTEWREQAHPCDRAFIARVEAALEIGSRKSAH